MNSSSLSLLATAALVLGAGAVAQNVVLRVQSTGLTGIPMQCAPMDVYGHGDGRTEVRRVYPQLTNYIVVAPQFVRDSGNRTMTFHHWELFSAPGNPSVDKPLGERILRTNIGRKHDVAIAHYFYEVKVSIRSIQASNVPIQLNAPDLWGQQNGTTQFNRRFSFGTRGAVFTAPSTHQGKEFYRWIVDGTDKRSIGVTTLRMNFTETKWYRTFTAQYGDYTKGVHQRIGLGCVGTNGRVKQTPRFNPDIGLTTRYQLFSGPRNAGVALALGTSYRRWGSAALPLRVGSTSCTIQNDPAIMLPMTTNASGFALQNLQIPKETALIGQSFYTQFWCVDLHANSSGVTTSDGYRTFVGGWKLF